MHTPFLRLNPAATATPATTVTPLARPPSDPKNHPANDANPLAELLASAPRQHALRLNPPTPKPAAAAPQARHAHD